VYRHDCSATFQRFAVKLNRNTVSKLALAQEFFSEEKLTGVAQ
jgi:hypothetical protein